MLDLDAMHELARGATHIVHCAAIAGVDTVLESPVRTMRVNIIGTYNVLEAALGTLDSVERFIDFSTSEVFGTHAFRVEEGQVSTIGSVGEARWTYAVSKLAGEHMAHAYHDELGLPAVTVHPFNVFGPGQIGGGAIRAFIENALAGRDLVIHGDGSQIRAWCYVDDMVAGTLACLEHPDAVGQAFNIGNPRATVTIYDLALRIKRLTGADVDITFQPLHYADVELRIPNVEKAREVLGFAAKVDLDEGLEKTIAWYREKALSRVRLALPGARRGGAGGGAERLRVGCADDGPEGRRSSRSSSRRRAGSSTPSRSRTAPPRSTSPCWRSGSARATRSSSPRTPSRRRRASSRLAGATPVLVDIDPATFNLDLAAVYEAVTPRTKAVLAVHLFGRPLDWEALQNAVPPEVLLIEDAAGALGARWRGMPCGGLGTMGCLSFHPRKIVTTGEGGAVTTQDAELAASIRRLRNHGLDAERRHRSALDELPARRHPLRDRDSAASPARRAARRPHARRRRLHASGSPAAVDVPDADEGDTHGWQAYVIRLDRQDEALETLRAEGIEVQIGTYALHRLSAYRDQGPFPGADAAFDRALALPLHSRLTDDDLDRVAAGILRFA